jgi:hypothetical protein
MAVVTKSIGDGVAPERDYDTIVTWEAALGGAAGGAGNDAIGEGYNDSAFDETVLINDATPDTVNLSVASGERHDGTAGSGTRIVRTGNGTVITLGVVAPTVRVEWWEVDINGNNVNSGAGIEQPALSNTLYVQVAANCIVHGHNGEIASAFKGSTTRQSTWLNCIGYDIECNGDTGAPSSIFYGPDDKSMFYNCIAHDLNRTDERVDGEADGFDITTDSKCKIATDDTDSGANYSAGADDGVLLANLYVSTAAGNEDLHVQDAAADQVDVGVDLADLQGVNVDIDGFDRHADDSHDPWDIGAHELVPAASSSGELASSSSSAPTAPIMASPLLLQSGRYIQGA